MRHRAVADVGELEVRVGDDVADARLGAGETLREQRGLALAVREAPRRDRLPQHHAHAEEIGASIDRIARGLLRRDVGELALEDPALRRARGARGLRDAEVDQLHLPVVGDERVLGAHVAVHHVQRGAVEVLQRVRVVEAGEHVGEDPHVDVEGHARARGLAQQRVERLPVEVVHRQEVVLAGYADLVRVHHVGVIQPRREPRLVEEHRQEVGVRRQLVSQHLDDEQLVDPHRARDDRQEHGGHAALAELRDDPVFPEAAFHGRAHTGVGNTSTYEIVSSRT